MNNLIKEYSVDEISGEIGIMQQDEWDSILGLLNDSSVYQTQAYAIVRWGLKNTLHMTFRKKGELIGAVQFRMMKVPLFNVTLAYSYWGPMFMVAGKESEYERNAVSIARTIYKELVRNRKWFVRVKPGVDSASSFNFTTALTDNAFVLNRYMDSYQSFLIDTGKPEEVLLKEAKKNWRNHLKNAQKKDLCIEETTDEKYFELFHQLFNEMHNRKKFEKHVDVEEFYQMQPLLSEKHRLHITICRSDDKPISAMVWSAIGNRGLPLFSATVGEGLKLKSSYLIRWHLLLRLKELNVSFLDQGGVNKGRNPGGYSFKSGMGGIEITHIGTFDCHKNQIILRGFQWIEYLLKSVKKKSHTLRSAFKLK